MSSMMSNQMTTTLNLVVITAGNIGASLAFYEGLGLKLTLERHGSGPDHYAAVCEGGLVFELHPASERRRVSEVRLGFSVTSIDRVLECIAGTGGSVAVPAKHGQWGLRATLNDPDGNKVDIVQRNAT